jgi:hypothetical protein
MTRGRAARPAPRGGRRLSRRPPHIGKWILRPAMGYVTDTALILLVLLLALVFAGIGFAVHLLWIVAVIVFVAWLVGWAFARGETATRRQWWGRW